MKRRNKFYPVQINLTEAHIIRAYELVKNLIEHTDSPTIYEMCLLRNALAVPEQAREAICLYWLRNRVVAARKKGLLGKQDSYARTS